MGCCGKMMKYVIFLLNFIFLLTGCVLVGAGAYVQAQMREYFDFLGTPYLNASVVFIVIGAVIVVVAFFGCCGTCTENGCMLFTYAVMMLLILLVEIGLAVTIYVFKNDAREFVSAAMRNGMHNYERPGSEGVRHTWDPIQQDFLCCGVESYLDWKNTTFGEARNGVPDTCCKTNTPGCGKGVFGAEDDLSGINKVGCFKTLEETILGNVAVVAGIGVAVAVFQVIVVIVSCSLAKNLRRTENYV